MGAGVMLFCQLQNCELNKPLLFLSTQVFYHSNKNRLIHVAVFKTTEYS